ncbi:MAG: DUF3887 domain-containing protein [Actinomycetota bacterium]|nr:DUF3887 domain-containing protein [Actinomycetota bacterium]
MQDEEAKALAESILDDYIAKRWDAVRTDFDERMLDALSQERLEQVSSSITDQFAGFVSSGKASTKTLDGMTVVDIPVTFEKGELKFRVSLSQDGKVAGLFLLDPAVV